MVFRPGKTGPSQHYKWDIGSAGSTTALALAVLPVLAYGAIPTSAELRGGLFQDFAPSFFHLQQVILPLLHRMGLEAEVEMGRPGYVPLGGGILYLTVSPLRNELLPLILEESGPIEKVWGIALASKLQQRRVGDRMAQSAGELFTASGYNTKFQVIYDSTAQQPGAALAAFIDLVNGSRLGSDRAGAPGRRSESIGKHVARELLKDLNTGATLDRYASDQIILYAALAAGESKFRIPQVTDHIRSAAWLAKEFLGADVRAHGQQLAITGVGFRARLRQSVERKSGHKFASFCRGDETSN
jgi:RNA 3'-terminal phosphate cyclase (ATP)